jgi:surface antigen
MAEQLKKQQFLAKSSTALGKLCLVLAFSNPVLAQSWHSPAFDSWADPRTGAGMAYNLAKWFSARLSKEDVAQHRGAVYTALNNLDNGEIIAWRNEPANTEGQVQIAYTWPAGGIICRRVYSYVRVKENAKAYQDTACLDSNQKTWTFVDKY